MAPPRRPGQRAGLTHDQVMTAAGELLADQGARALTMRALAARLGVSPNALYSHVASKHVLIDDLLDHALAAVSRPAAALDPVAGVSAVMTSSYQVLITRADLVPLYLERRGAHGPHARQLGDVVLGLLASAGVDAPRARQALEVLIVYTIGAAAFAASPQVAAGRSSASFAAEQSAGFGRGLEWILTGVAGRR